MPYVSEEVKTAIQQRPMESPGELNFLLTVLCIEYLNSRGESYQTHNDIIGALDCAAREWYRRVVVPYEDKKRAENGDVYYDPGADPAEPPKKERKRGRRKRKGTSGTGPHAPVG